MNILSNSKLYVKYIDNVLGWSVFTNEKIKEGETVEICYCVPEKISSSNFKDYLFSLNNEFDKGYLVLGYGMIYNHSFNPNIGWKIYNYNLNLIRFFALRDILPDEELRHDYGEKYWKKRTNTII